MRKYERILLWIAIIVSIIAIGVALYRSFNLEWDGVMFAMAMLSAIIVLLIGWNIYTLIDIKKVEEKADKNSMEFERIKKAIEYELEFARASLNLSLTDLYLDLNNAKPNDAKEYKLVFYSIATILSASKIRDFDTCNTISKILLEVLNPEQLLFGKKEKDDILTILFQTVDSNKIINFNEMTKKIMEIRIRD